MRIGIFFGGLSREREISFAGVKTVWAALDRNLFEPSLFFVDGTGRFTKLDERFLEQPDTRSFYPPKEHIPEYQQGFRVYAEALENDPNVDWTALQNAVGAPVRPSDFAQHMDFALIMLHGPYGEDGTLQGLLEWFNIPYSGCGLLPSALSIDKVMQKELADQCTPHKPRPFSTFHRKSWLRGDRKALFEELKRDVGLPMVIKAPYQGSSIGVHILRKDDFVAFEKAVCNAFFIEEIPAERWTSLSQTEKEAYVNQVNELDTALGFPVIFIDNSMGQGFRQIYIDHPHELIHKLDAHFEIGNAMAILSSRDTEEMVLAEAYIAGREFSCGVLENNEGEAVALPPTEIVTGHAGYDFKAKYVPGASQKVLPIPVSSEHIRHIQQVCEEVFRHFQCQVCVRIDGFIDDEGRLQIIDINSVPGMSPTSLILRQAAEVGLDSVAFLTYLIRQSLRERTRTGKRPYPLRQLRINLDTRIQQQKEKDEELIRLGLLLTAEQPDLGEALIAARRAYTRARARHTSLPRPILAYEKDDHWQYALLPAHMLLRLTHEELLEDLHKPRHETLLETEAKHRETAAFYNLQSPLEVQHYSASQLPEVIDAVHYFHREDSTALQLLKPTGLNCQRIVE